MTVGKHFPGSRFIKKDDVMKKIPILFVFLSFLSNGLIASPDSTATKQEQDIKQKKHRFIDEDGDGIADDRVKGLGFKYKRTSIEKQFGKQDGNVQNHSASAGNPTPQGKTTQKRKGKQ